MLISHLIENLPTWKIEPAIGDKFTFYKDFKGRRANDGQHVSVFMNANHVFIHQKLVEIGKRKYNFPTHRFVDEHLELDYGFVSSNDYEEDNSLGWYNKYNYLTKCMILSIDKNNEIKERLFLRQVFDDETVKILKKEFKKIIFA